MKNGQTELSETHLLQVEGSRPWCLRCRRPGATCLCAYISTLRPRTKFVFLTHPKEVRKIKNGSGRLAHLSLEGSELIVGIDFDQNPRVRELLASPDHACRLLYPPPPNHPSPEPAPRAPTATPVLFVLDGTWACAKKMMRVSTLLHPLPRVGLTVDRPSEFLIKQQPAAPCLATIEAVDRTLHALAAAGEERYDADESERLLRPFHRMVAMGLEYATHPDNHGPRPGKKHKRSGQRVRSRTTHRSGRNVMFLG